MRIAFLDLDHTLLTADSNELWMEFLHQHGLVSAAEVATHDHFMGDYARGELDFASLQEFRIRIDASLDCEKVRIFQSQFEREILLPAIAPRVPALLSELKGQGIKTIIVSATRSSLVEPVAKHLGVDHTISSCFGVDKVKQVQAWLGVQGTSIEKLVESRFYSDSYNDLPLLDVVNMPVAVDPDGPLERIAAERKWPVISLRGGRPINNEK